MNKRILFLLLVVLIITALCACSVNVADAAMVAHAKPDAQQMHRVEELPGGVYTVHIDGASVFDAEGFVSH
ncbi:MAG: hypothetical protein ACOYJB_00565 [Christensenellaceae bacterium]|jgi:hypothetical protein